MKRFYIILLTAATAGILIFAACKEQPSNEPAPAPAPSIESPKPTPPPAPAASPEQYRDQAQKEITEDNAKAELERLKAEIEADLEEPE